MRIKFDRMKANPKNQSRQPESLLSELLVLPDGRILVHNLTQPLAGLLRQINFHDRQIALRALPRRVSRVRAHQP